MLRNVDLDLAVKTGIMDQDTRNKIDYGVIRDDSCYNSEVALHEEIKKLNEVVVQLSKELLDKSKQVEDLRKNLNYLVHEKDNLSEYIDEYRNDRNMLEKIIDKLEKRN